MTLASTIVLWLCICFCSTCFSFHCISHTRSKSPVFKLAYNSLRNAALEHFPLSQIINEKYQVELIATGRNNERISHKCLCPFHDDRNPSLAVTDTLNGGLYHCFSCGASGNTITYIQNREKLSTKDEAWNKLIQWIEEKDPGWTKRMRESPVSRSNIGNTHQVYKQTLSTTAAVSKETRKPFAPKQSVSLKTAVITVNDTEVQRTYAVLERAAFFYRTRMLHVRSAWSTHLLSCTWVRYSICFNLFLQDTQADKARSYLESRLLQNSTVDNYQLGKIYQYCNID